jgi:predicted mannosyl-3-phosphoglycerate phosphatase (HAD superfamily)
MLVWTDMAANSALTIKRDASVTLIWIKESGRDGAKARAAR